MKTLVLLRPSREALKLKLESVESIVALDHPSGIIKVRTISSAEYLGYMVKFE